MASLSFVSLFPLFWGISDLRKRRKVSWWSKFFVSDFLAMMMAVIAMTGGALSGAVPWIFLIPLLAGFLLGIRAAVITAAVEIAFFTILFAAHFHLGPWHPAEMERELALLSAFSHVAALIFFVAMAVVWITALNSTQKDLRKAKREAEDANRAKSAFLATMSHEIRTPMNGILGMADLALETKLDSEQQDAVQTIHGCANSLLGLLNDILDLSKIEAEQLVLEQIPFSLPALMEEVLDSLAAKVPDSGVAFNVLIGSDLPIELKGDPTRIRQVLLNLAGNALKFTQGGEVLIEANLGEDRSLLLTVKDTGIGMKEEFLPTLFDEFTQEDSSTTREYGGTGLGMAITLKLVKAMNGSLRVNSEEGVGTEIEIRLPLCASNQGNCLESHSELTGRRVAVAYFHPTTERVVTNRLAQLGIEAVPADADQVDAILLSTELGLEIVEQHLSSNNDQGKAIVFHPNRESARVWAKNLNCEQRVLLPLRPSKLEKALCELWLEKEKPSHSTPAAEGAFLSRSSARVLLAEDNAVNAKLAMRLMQKVGIQADHVVNGEEAVRAVRENNYALVLMDCQMPKLDGYEATRRIRLLPGPAGKIPILAMTANAMVGDREACLAAGMNDYLSKPINRRTFERMLREHLGREAA